MRRFRPAVAGLLVLCSGCASSGGHDAGAAPSGTAGQSRVVDVVDVVALGDSDATGIGDPSAQGWVGRFGDLLEARTGSTVRVDNRAREGETSDELRAEVAGDAELRKALGRAEVVLVGIGGADLNAGDDALGAGSCRGRDCYAGILRRFDANIAAIASEVHRVAPGALVRGISPANAVPGAGSVIPSFLTVDLGRYQATTERASLCRALRSVGGRCVDVVTAFNGPRGDGDAYAQGLLTTDPCCYPSAQGQQLIAELLLAEGLDGLPGTASP